MAVGGDSPGCGPRAGALGWPSAVPARLVCLPPVPSGFQHLVAPSVLIMVTSVRASVAPFCPKGPRGFFNKNYSTLKLWCVQGDTGLRGQAGLAPVWPSRVTLQTPPVACMRLPSRTDRQLCMAVHCPCPALLWAFLSWQHFPGAPGAALPARCCPRSVGLAPARPALPGAPAAVSAWLACPSPPWGRWQHFPGGPARAESGLSQLLQVARPPPPPSKPQLLDLVA